MRLFVGTSSNFCMDENLFIAHYVLGVKSEFLIIAMATWMI